MKFLGRTAELKHLTRELNADDMRMTLIYGRRRIGKSELVKQAVRENNIKTIYYECKQVT
jgi:AAA+ ATPase superfamily predicted ATPase